MSQAAASSLCSRIIRFFSAPNSPKTLRNLFRPFRKSDSHRILTVRPLLRRPSVVATPRHTLSGGTIVTVAFSRMSSSAADDSVAFQLSPSSVLKIQMGDITRWSVDGSSDAIVNPANERMLGGGGADGAIHRAAGPELREACYEVPEVRPGVRCPTGEARITPYEHDHHHFTYDSHQHFYAVPFLSRLRLHKIILDGWDLEEAPDHAPTPDAGIIPTPPKLLVLHESLHKDSYQLELRNSEGAKVVCSGVGCSAAGSDRGFRLPASHVIHTVGPIYDSDKNPEAALRNAYRNSLRVAKEHNFQYIAFTAISCGVYGYPFDEAAKVAISTVNASAGDFKEVHFVLFSDEIYNVVSSNNCHGLAFVKVVDDARVAFGCAHPLSKNSKLSPKSLELCSDFREFED
ncbi:hypothetical protein SASPL_136595 [Salvia splendens]|uniref:Macro domain-containing protein n=1 Tax=Salvia splendens TaxID=180675 RepID=A0A8X8X1L1_SALSN|nr:hypothetical protein SASPL_136595 [Salvia splendens]